MFSIHARSVEAVAGSMMAMWLALALGATPAPVVRGPAPAPAPASAEPDSAAAPVRFDDARTRIEQAFDREINAKETYLSFARVADLEGQPGVASLFRAVARAEQVHADQHVKALAWLGGKARAQLERPVLGTTAENLQRAIELERYDVDVFYPGAIEQARGERSTQALRSSTLALVAERDHLRLFTAALASLEQHPAGLTYHVCPTCGRVFESGRPRKCPNCFTPGGRFLKVT